MPIIAVSVDKDIDKQMSDLNKRLTVPTIKNIFLKGEIYQLSNNRYAINVRPLMYPFYYLGVLGLAATLILNNFHWSGWHIFPIILSSSYIFFNSYTLYAMLMVGMHKQGYKGKFEYLKHEDVLGELLENGTKRYTTLPESQADGIK